jgi:hypothetical protein
MWKQAMNEELQLVHEGRTWTLDLHPKVLRPFHASGYLESILSASSPLGPLEGVMSPGLLFARRS